MLASTLRLLAAQSNSVLSTLMRLQSQCSRHGGGGSGSREDSNHGISPDLKLACQRDAMLLLDKKLRGSEPLTDMELPSSASPTSSSAPHSPQTTAASIHSAMVDFSKLLRVGSFFASSTETARIADALRFVAKHKEELTTTRQITFLCTPLLNLKDGSTGGARYVERELLPVLLRTLRSETTSASSSSSASASEVTLSEKELNFRRGALIAACQIVSHLADDAQEAVALAKKSASAAATRHAATVKEGDVMAERSAELKSSTPHVNAAANQPKDVPHAVELEQLVNLFCALCESMEWLRRNGNAMLDVADCGAVLHMYHVVENLCTLYGADSTQDTVHAVFSGGCRAYVQDSLAVACKASCGGGSRRVADVNAVLMAAGQLKRVEDFRTFSQAGIQILPSALSSGNVKDLSAAVQNLVRIRNRQHTLVPQETALHFIEALRPRLFGAGGPGGFRFIHHSECSRLMSFLARLDVPLPADVVDLLSAHFVNNVRLASVQQITPFVQGMARAATTARSSAHSSAAGAASAFESPSFQTVLDKIVLRAQQCDAPAMAAADMAALLASLTALRYIHVTAFFESCEAKLVHDVTGVREGVPISSSKANSNATLSHSTVSTVLAALDTFSKEASAASPEEQQVLLRASQLRAQLMAAIVNGQEVSSMTPRELVQLLDQMAASESNAAADNASEVEGFQPSSQPSLEDSEKPELLSGAAVDGGDSGARKTNSSLSLDAPEQNANLKPVLLRVMSVLDSCTMRDAATLARAIGNLVHRRQLSKNDAAPVVEAILQRVESVAQDATARDVLSVLRAAFTAGQPIQSPAFWNRAGTLATEEPIERLQRWSYFVRGIAEKRTFLETSDGTALHETDSEKRSARVAGETLLDAQIDAMHAIFARIPGALEQLRSVRGAVTQPARSTAESRFAQLAALSYSLSRLHTVCSARLKERAALLASEGSGSTASRALEGQEREDAQEEGEDDDEEDGVEEMDVDGSAAVYAEHNLLIEAAFASIGDAVCATLHHNAAVGADGARATSEPSVAPKSVVILLTSFVDVRVQHPAMFYDILPLLKRLVHQLGPLEFSLVLHAYAALGVWNARLMGSLAVDMGAKLSESDIRQCASVLNGLQRSKLLKRSAIINGSQRELNSIATTGSDPILVLTMFTVQRMCLLVSTKSSVAELLRDPSAAQSLAFAASTLSYFDVPPQPALDTYIALTTKSVLAGTSVDGKSSNLASVAAPDYAALVAAALSVAPLIYKMSSEDKKSVAARAIVAFFQRVLEADQRMMHSANAETDLGVDPRLRSTILKPGQYGRVLAAWHELSMLFEVPSLATFPAAAAHGTRMACASLLSVSTVSNFAANVLFLARLVGAPMDFIASRQEEKENPVPSIREFLCVSVVNAMKVNQRVFESSSSSIADDYVKGWNHANSSVRAAYCGKLDAVSLIKSASWLYSSSDNRDVYCESFAQLCSSTLPTAVSVLFRNVQQRRATADERCVLVTGFALSIASGCCNQDEVCVQHLCEVSKGVHMNEKHVSIRGAAYLFLSLAVLKRTQIAETKSVELQDALMELRTIATRALVSRIGCMDASADVLQDMHELVAIGDGAVLEWMRSGDGADPSADSITLDTRVRTTLAKLRQESVRYGYPWFSEVFSQHVESLF